MTPLTRSRLILAFSACWLAAQVFLIVRGHFVEDKRFAFWMFSESTRYTATLYRRTADGRVVKTERGRWTTRGRDGADVTWRWTDHVRDFRLAELETNKRAKTGWHVTKLYLQLALDYVAAHTPEDRETVELILEIDYDVAGTGPRHMTLKSATRDLR